MHKCDPASAPAREDMRWLRREKKILASLALADHGVLDFTLKSKWRRVLQHLQNVAFSRVAYDDSSAILRRFSGAGSYANTHAGIYK